MANLSVKVTETGVEVVKKGLKGLGDQGKKTEISLAGVGSAAKTLTGYTVAATAAIIGFTSVMASNATQLKKNATNANLTVKEFQNIALSASTVGVNVDQLGSILADTQEKVGDFLATGAGGFMDFVDVMGLTTQEAMKIAKEFENLSGRDVLIQMTSKMEAAGISTQKMAFALEGMASDSRDLIPLLLQNGAELEVLEGRFDSMATTISDDTVASLNDLSTVSLVVAKNMGNTLATALAGVSEYLIDAGENAAFFWASLQKGTEQQLTSDMADVAEDIKAIQDSIERGIKAGYNTTADQALTIAEARLAGLRLDYKKLEDEYQNKFGVGVIPRGDGVDLKPVKLIADDAGADETKTVLSMYEKQQAALKAAREKSQQDAINSQVEALQRQFDTEEEVLQQRIELIKQSDLEVIDQLVLQEQLETEIRNRKIDAEIAGFEEIQKAKSQAAKDAAKMTAEEERSERERVSLLMSATGMIASALDERSTAYKVAATAQAIASTYATAQEVYRGFNEAFPQPYGMIAGGAAAGAAVGIGLANVAEINKSRAQGGMVSRGDNVEVGERGREIFVPNTDGRILNQQQINSQMNGSGGDIIINNNASRAEVTAERGDDGNTYIRVDELDEMVGAALSNANSESFRGLQSAAKLERN